MDVFRGHAAAGVRHVRVMLAGGIDGRVSQHVRHQVNIAGLVVEVGGIGAPQLVGTDFRLQGRRYGGVFFDEILHGPLGDPPALQAQEQGVLMTGDGFDSVPFIHIVRQRFRHFGREVEDDLVSALPGYYEGVVFQVHVADIHADALADADPGAQEKGEDRIVAPGGNLLEFLLVSGQLVAALRLFEHTDHLVLVQADNGLLMNLRQGNEFRDVGGNPLVFKKIIIKGTDRTQFAFDGQFMVDKYFVRYRRFVGSLQVIGQVLGVGDDIVPGQFFQVFVVHQTEILLGETDAFIVQESEKRVQIDGIGEPRERTGRYSNRPEEIRAGLREPAGDLPDLKDTFCVQFVTVLAAAVCHVLRLPEPVFPLRV